MVIARYEPGMNFFEAIYFNFVSLTTIGLGDLVPKNEPYLVVTLVYSAIGLALTTNAVEIAAEYLRMLHYFGRNFDHVGNVKIWFANFKTEYFSMLIGQQKGRLILHLSKTELRLTMKQLVRNFGDHFNIPLDEIANLNLHEFVEAAIKVEAGEISTLRCLHPINVGIESMIFVDDDELCI
ncbi:unnamed protein product [Thelazia callipaeda]|uniref:Ion_trans_2 domain-containing protein n=1 Tax=Thelazia callipaeda TaxID=103827 RepID=A0A0N5D834_THECL|nr:unnamed protein product [Thelazia callipaeda]